MLISRISILNMELLEGSLLLQEISFHHSSPEVEAIDNHTEIVKSTYNDALELERRLTRARFAL